MRPEQIEKNIKGIKKELMEIDDMRPGSLSQQSRKTKEKYGSYWHLSYTHRNKGHTEYIRSAVVKQIQGEVENYRYFRELIDRWIDLSIEKSKLKISQTIKK